MADSQTLSNAKMRAQSSMRQLDSVRDGILDVDEVLLRSIMNGFQDAAELIRIEIEHFRKRQPGSDLTLSEHLELEDEDDF